jgi:hypothetical protein
MKKLFHGLASNARLLHSSPNVHKYIGNIKCPPKLHSTNSTNQETVEASLVLNAKIVANFSSDKKHWLSLCQLIHQVQQHQVPA